MAAGDTSTARRQYSCYRGIVPPTLTRWYTPGDYSLDAMVIDVVEMAQVDCSTDSKSDDHPVLDDEFPGPENQIVTVDLNGNIIGNAGGIADSGGSVPIKFVPESRTRPRGFINLDRDGEIWRQVELFQIGKGK